MKILALDTSTDSCSVALLVDQNIYGKTILKARKHNELVLPTIDGLLKEHQLKLEALDYFACGIGPGSFVGVRLGVSIIQGLAFAVNKPVIAFSSMAALAAMAIEQKNLSAIQIGLDARMGDIYYGCYQKLANGTIQTINEKSVKKEAPCLDESISNVAGDGFLDESLKAYQVHELNPLTLRHIMPSILALAQSNQVITEVEDLQPVYLQGTNPWQKS